MKIEIFGPGCARCKSLAANAKAAADKLGIDCELVKVTDFNEIASRGVLMTPALAIDGTVKVIGRLASEEEIAGLLRQGEHLNE